MKPMSWSTAGNYGAHVLRLVKKADRNQREVLRLVYPDHVRAVEAWEQAPARKEGE